jgi:hypothetical protein
MDIVTEVVKRKLGMTLEEFCTKHLNCERQAFSVRLRKNKLYPNEYLYIALITGTPIKELFGQTYEDTFIYRGDEEVSKRLRRVIADVNDPERFIELLSAEINIPVKSSVAPNSELDAQPDFTPEESFLNLPEQKNTVQAPESDPPEEPVQFVFEDTFN